MRMILLYLRFVFLFRWVDEVDWTEVVKFVDIERV